MSKAILGGWYYPSAPCWPNLSLTKSKYKGINQLCGEFLRFVNNILPDGSCVEVMTERNYGIGGFTEEHVQQLKDVCSEPYCTVSGRSYTGVSRMLENADLLVATVNKIVNFCKNNGLGCDMNIEGLASFTKEECLKHTEFLDKLGKLLAENNVNYRVVTVAEDGNLYHGNWRNDYLREVTCDYVVCMQYDRMYDYGRQPITPIDFLEKTTNEMKKSLGPSWKEKYICGLPNYGYKAYINNEYWIELVTIGQLSRSGLLPLPETRESESKEVTWEGSASVRNKPKGPVYYFYSDQVSLDHKTKFMLKQGVNKFSLWHMFGGRDMRDTNHLNPWFSDDIVDAVKSTESELKPESKPESSPKTESNTAPQQESNHDLDPEPESKPESSPKSESNSAPQQEANHDLEPEPESNPEHYNVSVLNIKINDLSNEEARNIIDCVQTLTNKKVKIIHRYSVDS